MNEVEKLGIVQTRRIYADWTSEIMRGWRQTVLTNALTPVHQFQSSLGKGNSDSMMIIDAMDLLYKYPDIEAFCIVSSDADFTRLATKIREEGKLVLGIGSNLTPAPFVVACNRFVYLHNLVQDDVAPPLSSVPPSSKAFSVSGAVKSPVSSTSSPSTVKTSKSTKSLMAPDTLRSVLPLLTQAWEAYRADSGWASLMGVDQELTRLDPGFSPTAYGEFSSVEELMKATQAFETRKSKSSKGSLVRRLMVSPSHPNSEDANPNL